MSFQTLISVEFNLFRSVLDLLYLDLDSYLVTGLEKVLIDIFSGKTTPVRATHCNLSLTIPFLIEFKFGLMLLRKWYIVLQCCYNVISLLQLALVIQSHTASVISSNNVYFLKTVVLEIVKYCLPIQHIFSNINKVL